MTTLSLMFPLIILSFLYVITGDQSVTAVRAAATNHAADFITTSCRATTYPSVCVLSLSTFASSVRESPKQLVKAALSVSVARAGSTKTFVRKLSKFRGLKPREYAAIKDCWEEMSDGLDKLIDSVRELRRLGQAHEPDFVLRMSNLQVWVSAALTDYSTCMDGFSGRALNGRVKSSVRARITNVAQVTSNALALINQFAGKY